MYIPLTEEHEHGHGSTISVINMPVILHSSDILHADSPSVKLQVTSSKLLNPSVTMCARRRKLASSDAFSCNNQPEPQQLQRLVSWPEQEAGAQSVQTLRMAAGWLELA